MRKCLICFVFFFIPFNVFALSIDCPDVASIGEEISCEVCHDGDIGSKVHYSFDDNLEYSRLVMRSNWEPFYYDMSGFVLKRVGEDSCIGNLFIRVSSHAKVGDICHVSLRQIEGTNQEYGHLVSDDVSDQIRIVSDVSTLDKIVLSDGKISLPFQRDVYSYEVHTYDDVLNISGVPSDDRASISGDLGKHSLMFGANSFQLKVTSERGNSQIYSLVVIRDVNPYDIRKKDVGSGLKSFVVGDKEYFVEKGVFSYRVDVGDDVEFISIKGNPFRDDAAVSIFNIEHLEYGENVVRIRVLDGDEEFGYVLVIYRHRELDSNIRIKKINIKGYSFDFYSDVYEYNLVIGNESSLDMDIELESDTSSFLVVGNENLKTGSVVSIKVVAEDGSNVLYNIHIKKESLVSNSRFIFDKVKIPVLVLLVVLFVILLLFKIFKKMIIKKEGL